MTEHEELMRALLVERYRLRPTAAIPATTPEDITSELAKQKRRAPVPERLGPGVQPGPRRRAHRRAS